VSWARSIPLDQIPCVLVFLAGRLMTARQAGLDSEPRCASGREAENLLSADALAGRLGVPTSWVRSEERVGRIPSVRLGKYVRFKLLEVERALAERQRQGA
jgi:hypothetical protein